MGCRCGATFLTPLLAIAGLVAAGTAGYRVINGCGSCSAGVDAAVTTTLVSTTPNEAAGSDCGLCAGHPECVTMNASGCCQEQGAAKNVAMTEKAGGCCSEGAAKIENVSAVEKTTKEGDCCAGEEKSGCCGGCEGEKKEEKKEGTVATSGK